MKITDASMSSKSQLPVLYAIILAMVLLLVYRIASIPDYIISSTFGQDTQSREFITQTGLIFNPEGIIYCYTHGGLGKSFVYDVPAAIFKDKYGEDAKDKYGNPAFAYVVTTLDGGTRFISASVAKRIHCTPLHYYSKYPYN